MNLNQLKIFYSVAKEKSFSLAAKNVFLTQPAVTIQIHLLEEHFGLRLFDRKGRNLALTEAGEILYTYAEQILNMVREVENIITDFKSLDRGLLKIATSRTIAKYYIPKILPLFKKRYPKIKIDLKAGNSQEAVDWVLNFTSDIGIVAGIDYPDKLAGIPIFEDQLVLITSPNSRLFGTGKIQFKELGGKPLIIREAGSGIRSLLLKEFEKEGICPNIVMELGNEDTIKQLVMDGMGLSILTWPMVMEEVRGGLLKAIPVTDKKLFINVDFVFHKSRESSHLIQAFKNLIFELLPKIKSIFPSEINAGNF